MTATSAAEQALMLEMIIERPQGTPTGIRVYADGRYDHLSDTQIDVAADGRSSTRSVPLAWRTVTTFSASELDELRAAIRAADFPGLQQRYTPTGTTHDAGIQTWRVWLDGTLYEVKVEGYPITTVPALDTLFRRFSELRKLPPSSSVWKVWVDGKIQQRSVNCDVSGVAALRPLTQAIFTPQAPPAGATPVPAADLPNITADTLLVEIVWQELGRPEERTLVYGDGRVLSVIEGRETLLHTLNGTQLIALLEAGAQIKWSELPEPVCG